jgi:adenosine kinase
MSSLNQILLGIGNPLLDISANVEQPFLDKYEVKVNNAILADEKHLPMYDELVNHYPVEYIAGGATQNSIRVAQWMLQAPGATSYIGCVGQDKFGKQLRECAVADGVAVHYLEDKTTPTGTCACLIHNKERSLIANLSAANKYQADHLQQPEIDAVVKAAKFYYSAGFFLTVSPEALMTIAKHAHETKKTLAINLSAPFICQFFDKPLLAAIEYADYVFGNEGEAEAFGQKQGYTDTSAEAVAVKLSEFPKANANRPRIVIITQGAKQTVVASAGKVQTFDVPVLDASLIVDVNGAGDAFVGGFLSQLVQGADIEKSVHAGHYAARTILQVSGTSFTSKPSF